MNRIIFTTVLKSLFCILLFSQPLTASEMVDTTFNAFPSRDITSGLSELEILPDGKLLIYGSFEVVNGVAVGRLVRLNSDGTTDTSFNCPECIDIEEMSVLVQNDGKVVVAGYNATSFKSKLIRLNADGSLDTSFSVNFDESQSFIRYRAYVYAKQSDGKIFVGHHVLSNSRSLRLYRLNTDGSVDESFVSSTAVTSGGRPLVFDVTPLPDGKVLFCRNRFFGGLTRLNADGTQDSSFTGPSFTRVGAFLDPIVLDIGLQSSGKYVIVGYFDTANGLDRKNLARLNSDGSVDLTFNESVDNFDISVDIYSDDKLLVGKRLDISAPIFPIKLTADGIDDTSLNFPKDLASVSYFKLDRATDKIYIFGSFDEGVTDVLRYARLNADGSLDNSFNTVVGGLGKVNGLAIQSDQKIVLVGDFNHINNFAKANIARVNTDGTLDGSFDGGSGFVGSVKDVVLASGGKMYVYGDFNGFDGNVQGKIVRLNSDGSIDSSFVASVDNRIDTLALQSDGKILIGGVFTNVNGQFVKQIARLNSDGTTDVSFNPILGNVSFFSKIIVLNDGKILAGGDFSGVGGFNRENLARLNSDGSYDSSFDPSISIVRDIAQLPNGQYFAMTNEIIKLNLNGTVDTSFDSPTFSDISSGASIFDVLRFRILPDDSLIVFGEFERVDGFTHQGLVRLFSDGRRAGVSFPNGTNSGVFDIEQQDDGKIVVGGEFAVIENTFRPGFARLSLSVLSELVDYDFDGDGKADIAVFRPSENKWYVLRSSDGGVTQQIFGINGDSPIPGDFDGDGTMDYSIFRNSQGDWWSLSSISGTQVFAHLGQDGDVPLPSDFDGDGRDDYVIYRPNTFTWYRVSSATGQFSQSQFGAAGDKPLVGDFDGDGKADRAIYRPSTGVWWYQSSIDNSQRATQWGLADDVPSPGDYDGDGITDFAVYRPSKGVWYILNSSSGNTAYTIIQFGIAEDKVVPGDYDGDGKTDIAVYRPSTGVWYLLQSTNGFAAYQFGISTDIPVPNALIQ